MDTLDLRPYLFDDACGFVPEYHGSHRYPPFALHHMIIGATEPNGCDTHQYFCGFRLIKLDALDRERFSNLPEDGGETIHD